MNIYEENWVVGDHGRWWTSNRTWERARRRVVPLGCQVEPVFARNCYTRFSRTSIENPKKKCSKEDMRGAEEAELFPGRPGYFPVAGLYQDGRTSILVGPTPRVWPL